MSKHCKGGPLGRAKTLLMAWGAVATWGCRPEPAGNACDDEHPCTDRQQCVDGQCRALPADAETPSVSGPMVVARGRGPVEPPRLRWEVPAGANVTASPVVVTRQGATVAIVATHAGRVFGVVAQGPDAGDVVVEAFVDGIIWSDPLAPGDGYVYFGADDDTLYAMAIDDGRLAWSTRLGACTPARATGPVGLRCDVDGGPSLGPGGDLMVGADGLYRVGREGAVKWRFPAEEVSPRYHVASRPVATERVIAFGAQDGRVHAVDPEGHERWSVEIGGDVDSDGVVAADGSIVIGGDNGRVYALDPDDGATRWAFATGRDVRGGIALGPDGGLFAASLDGNMYALSGSGAVRFIVPTQGPIASTPVVDDAGVVYFGSRDDRLYAVTGDGVVRWNLELPDDLDAAVAITPDGTVVVACDDGMLRGLQ